MLRLRGLLRRQRREEPSADPPPVGDDPREVAIIERCSPYTLTSAFRQQALLDAVGYCVQRGVPGSFAECGVWRGGSVLAMILKLQELGATDRDVYLYDTFEGMTKPSERDTSRFEEPALETWADETRDGGTAWSHLFEPEAFNEESVRHLLLSTGYPESRIKLVKGTVEATIPDQAPPELALVRLDTDWYESTRHELEHLYPRLSVGGVLIIDDYGHWDGARQAVDEYFANVGAPVLLNRIDYTARIAVKV
jgi:O-methyltransferase